MTRLKTVMFVGMLFAAHGFAQSHTSWYEEWFKAKHGRNSPAEEARLKREAASTAYREDPKSDKVRPSAFEQWFKAKYARYAPSEQARRDAEAASTAYRDATASGIDARDPGVQYRDYFKAKYGRDLPKR